MTIRCGWTGNPNIYWGELLIDDSSVQSMGSKDMVYYEPENMIAISFEDTISQKIYVYCYYIDTDTWTKFTNGPYAHPGDSYQDDTKSSIAVLSNGNPSIIYNESSTWNYVRQDYTDMGPFGEKESLKYSPYDLGSDIYVDTSGIIHMAYSSQSLGGLFYKKYGESEQSIGFLLDPEIFIYTTYPYIICTDTTFQFKLAWFNGASWTTESIVKPDVYYYIRIYARGLGFAAIPHLPPVKYVLDNNNTLHMCTHNGRTHAEANNVILYTKKALDGGTWSAPTSITVTDGWDVYQPSMILDSSNLPHFMSFMHTGDNKTIIEYGTNGIYTTVDSLTAESVDDFSESETCALNINNTIYLLYSLNGRIRLRAGTF